MLAELDLQFSDDEMARRWGRLPLSGLSPARELLDRLHRYARMTAP